MIIKVALVILIVVFLLNLCVDSKERTWKLKDINFLNHLPFLFCFVILCLAFCVALLFGNIKELSYEKQKNLITVLLIFFTALEFISVRLICQNNKYLIKKEDSTDQIEIFIMIFLMILLGFYLNIHKSVMISLINSKENILYSFYVYILFNAGVFLYLYFLLFLLIKIVKKSEIIFMNKSFKIGIAFFMVFCCVIYLMYHYMDIYLEVRSLNWNFLYIFVFGLAIIIIGILMFSQFIDNIMKEFYLFLNRSSQKLILENIFKISSILSVIISVVFYKAIVGEGVISDLVNLLSSCIIIPLLLEGVISEKEKSLNEDN